MVGGDDMQTKKEDIKETIINCAREEFILHGYENASMRTIARKANTSLGNIYHYFENKKDILNYLLEPLIINIEKYLYKHIELDIKITDIDQINEILENTDLDMSELKPILTKEFIILMETKEEEYIQARENLLRIFRGHIASHMKCKDIDNYFVVAITKLITDSIIHIIRCGECSKNKKKEIKNIFLMLCRSVVVHDLIEEEKDI